MKIIGLKQAAILGTCITGLMLSACGDKAEPKAKADAPQNSVKAVASSDINPAIWLMEDEDTKVYLFGTVHVLKPDMEWQTDQFKSILKSSDAIYLEADVSPETVQGQQAMIQSLAMYQDGRTLKDALSDEEEKSVDDVAKTYGLSLDTLNVMRPWMASLTLAQMQMVQSGYYGDSGAEMKILASAKENNIPMRYFETAEQQMRFFADLPEESQVDFLIASTEQMEEIPDMLDIMVSNWGQGKVEKIAEVMADPANFGDPKIHDILLTDRNARWVETLKDLMDEEAGTFMVAVGAGHLAGDDSVIAMLEAEGETVTRQ